MQSQLQAALLGHTNISNVSTSVISTHQAAAEDDDKDEPEDEVEDVDEFIEEEIDGESGQRAGKTPGNTSTSRTITLQMLLSAGILHPGAGSMTIEYLGQKFVGDLLADGKIRSQETDTVFASPSAWAIACKRFINPDKKSGCGWASVKYCGKKLDAYKNIWYKKKKEEEEIIREKENIMMTNFDRKYYAEDFDAATEMLELSKLMTASNYQPHQTRHVVKHNTIANRTFTHDANTLIECVPFSNLGKIQPFLVSLSTNAALLMDFHCHLTKNEMCGYLGGHWDVNGHNLQITHAFPCRNTKADRENATQVEMEIAKTLERDQLILVGWYHSHPTCSAAPTLRDVDAQLDYQIKMKGTSDNSYTPCIGIIISPYNYENTSLESSIIAYWVIPPPETKPNEYGRPMLMSYSVVQDSILASSVMDEMKKCADYYKKNLLNFEEKFTTTTTYLEKLKATLTSKFPRDQSESSLWLFMCDLLGCNYYDKESPISIPSVSKTSQILANLGTSMTHLNPMMMNSDIASVLFNSGKYSGNNLLGIPDPMAQSTLAANAMFLSPNLFKMQDLLKPLSTSSPVSTKTKSDAKNITPLKIPTGTEIKIPTDLNIFKNSTPISESIKPPKVEFSVADLSVSSIRPPKYEYSSMDLSKSISDSGEPSPKISKNYYSTCDLSMSTNKTLIEALENIPSNLSISRSENFAALNALIDSATSKSILE